VVLISFCLPDRRSGRKQSLRWRTAATSSQSRGQTSHRSRSHLQWTSFTILRLTAGRYIWSWYVSHLLCVKFIYAYIYLQLLTSLIIRSPQHEPPSDLFCWLCRRHLRYDSLSRSRPLCTSFSLCIRHNGLCSSSCTTCIWCSQPRIGCLAQIFSTVSQFFFCY
jgi:hypothetical protein